MSSRAIPEYLSARLAEIRAQIEELESLRDLNRPGFNFGIDQAVTSLQNDERLILEEIARLPAPPPPPQPGDRPIECFAYVPPSEATADELRAAGKDPREWGGRFEGGCDRGTLTLYPKSRGLVYPEPEPSGSGLPVLIGVLVVAALIFR